MGKTWGNLPLSTRIGKTLFEPRAEGRMDKDDDVAEKQKQAEDAQRDSYKQNKQMQNPAGMKRGGKAKKKSVKAEGKKTIPRLDRKRAK